MYKDTTGVVGGEGLESQGDRSVGGDREVRLPTAQSWTALPDSGVVLVGSRSRLCFFDC